MSHFINNVTKPLQTERTSPDQTKNPAGGYSWEGPDLEQFKRFLLVGTENGTYYESERALDMKSYQTILKLIQSDPFKALDIVVDVSDRGLAPRNTYAVLALAMIVANTKDPKVLKAAYESLPKVCRIPTHIFQYMKFAGALGKGNGSGFNRAIERWFNGLTIDKLALYSVKYRQREGWSLQDTMRVIRPNPGVDQLRGDIYRWLAREVWSSESEMPTAIKGYLEAQQPDVTLGRIVELIEVARLPREAIPTKFQNTKEAWEAMLPHLGVTAIIRNLANMTRYGLFDPSNPKMWDNLKTVEATITNPRTLKGGRVHPMTIFNASVVYSAGKGDKSSNTWTPVPQILDALNKAFYASYGAVEPTGKVFMAALDVSGSMGMGYAGTRRSNISLAAVLTLALYETEPKVLPVSFHCSGSTAPLTHFRKGLSIDEAARINTPAGATDIGDCVRYATEKKIHVDCFVIYSDGCGWQGPHASTVWNNYKKTVNPDARLIVVQLYPTAFNTFGTWNDPSLMTTGFSADLASIISGFASM